MRHLIKLALLVTVACCAQTKQDATQQFKFPQANGYACLTSGVLSFSVSGCNGTAVGIPASSFGFTVFDITHQISPVLPYTISRSWDSFHVSWAFLNPCINSYDWTQLDHFTATHAGKDMVYTFGVVPDWAASDPNANGPYPQSGGYFTCADGTLNAGGTSCSMPGQSIGDTSAWDTFVAAIATHAPQIKYWELWNEPMNYAYWCNGHSGTTFDQYPKTFAQYALMAQHARTIIKSIIPNAVILAPSTDKDFGIAWLNNYIGNGGTVQWDVMAIHGYSNDSPSAPAPDTLPAMVAQYVAFNAAHGGPLPIYDTEVALADDGGIDLVKTYVLGWSSNVSRTIWYAYDHDGITLWDPTTGVSPEGVAYQNVYNWLVGATMSTCAKDVAGTYTCAMARPGYQGMIAWNTLSTETLPAAAWTRYRSIQGVVTAVTGPVTVGNSPIILETGSY